MSKEIYKEYLCEWVDAYSLEARLKVNSRYVCKGFDLMSGAASLLCIAGNYESFTRKPKTQMINGHEVVAPRYDDDFTLEVWVFDPRYDDGVNYRISAELSEKSKVDKCRFGWFSSLGDCITYANAHKENKND